MLLQANGSEAVGMLQAGNREVNPHQRFRSDAKSPKALLDFLDLHSKVVECCMDGGAELKAAVEQLRTELKMKDSLN